MANTGVRLNNTPIDGITETTPPHGDDLLLSATFWSTLSRERKKRKSDDNNNIPQQQTDDDYDLYVLGTSICVQDVKDAIILFLWSFRHPFACSYEQIKYLMAIYRLLETERETENLYVDAHDVDQYDKDLYDNLVTYPDPVLDIFDTVLFHMVRQLKPSGSRKPLQARVFNLKASTSINNLNSSDIDKMVSLKGLMVISCSFIIPEMIEAVFKCLECGHFSDPILVIKGQNCEPTMCMNGECKTKNSMQLVHDNCSFVGKQIVRVQETPDEGGTPRTLSLLMREGLEDAVKPGDRVEITGICRSMPVRVFLTETTTQPLFKCYLDCLHIKRDDQGTPTMMDYEEQIEKLKELSRRPDIYEMLTRSLAPDVWVSDDVKKGLLCQLFGGTLQSGANFNGGFNILLVGDPGNSKSQLLQYIHKLAANGSGRGTIPVGLTAYVTKDTETGEMVLESGELVLTDRGISCIDKFDKMSESARSMLHEVMELQTVSTAKEGIIATLKATTSVLAPSGSCLSLTNNLHLLPPLLSRFDLIYIIADEPTDRCLAKRVVVLPSENVIDLPTLIAYLNYARENISPLLSDEAAEELTRGYVEMRSRGKFPGSSKKVTPRQSESLICLSEALARIRFSNLVEKRDVEEAFRLMEAALTDHATGTNDMDLTTTGVSASDRDNLAELTCNIVMEKLKPGVPSTMILELLEELKKLIINNDELSLIDLQSALGTLSSERSVTVHGDNVTRGSSHI